MKRIYISDLVHAQLKKEALADGRTLQWVVEDRLSRGMLHSGNTPISKKTEVQNPQVGISTAMPMGLVPEKNTSGASTEVSDLFQPDVAAEVVAANGEQPCCANEITPCKHWVWDVVSGEGYRNTLSGRLMEVE